MHASPESLQDCCINYISSNLHAVCTIQEQRDEKRISFTNQDVFFHDVISDQIIAGLSAKEKLNNMSIQVFDPSVTRLKRVRIEQCQKEDCFDQLSARGISILQEHNISELEAVGYSNISITDFLQSLNKNSVENLKLLNFTRTSFRQNQGFPTMEMAQMKNLRTLNLSSTSLNNYGLENMMLGLQSLENLDISCTEVSDISPLLRHRDKLKYLSLYNLGPTEEEDNFTEVIISLKYLKHLDMSVDIAVNPLDSLLKQNCNGCQILEAAETLPNLTSLDLSGREIWEKDMIRDFILRRPGLRFLGLLHTECAELPIISDKHEDNYRKDLKTTGEETEEQVMEALKRYPQRSTYVRKALYHLFNFTGELSDPRLDMIKLILPPMKTHSKELQLQMAATACLFNLTKQDQAQNIHPCWLSRVVSLTLDAMEQHASAAQLQKNALLTLCSDRILQDVNFDRARCARLVMDSLCAYNEGSMGRMAVAICSILAAKIPTEETGKIGSNPEYMTKLISIVKEKTESATVDITMKFTLSALWNLTDESPETCAMFLAKRGMELFMRALQVFKPAAEEVKIQVETKVLGLINNLAEVKHLRKHIMTSAVLPEISELLDSKKIDVSYFAAGILAHLASDEELDWNNSPVQYKKLLQQLGNRVREWEDPEGEMVAYRSFRPFFELLQPNKPSSVHQWAVWAIQHVCVRNAQKYCSMLIEEDGCIELEKLQMYRYVDDFVKTMCTNIVQLCTKFCGYQPKIV